MNALTAPSYESFIFAQGDDLKTTSLKISEAFDKRHSDVLRAIDKLLTQVSDSFRKRNFALSQYDQVTPTNGVKKVPMYELTKDGFMMVVMGFTGEKAMTIKEAYINAFNVMYNKLFPRTPYGLKSLPPSPYISEAESLNLRRHIEAFCKGDQKLYKAMYHKLYKGYNIAKYDQLPAGKLNEALVFLGLNNIQLSPQTEFPEQNIITMTQAELQAHDEQIASEAVKRVQGELVSEPSQDGVMLFLKNYSEKERRFLVHTKMNAAQITPVEDNCYVMTKDEFTNHLKKNKDILVIEKARLRHLSIKQLNDFITFI